VSYYEVFQLVALYSLGDAYWCFYPRDGGSKFLLDSSTHTAVCSNRSHIYHSLHSCILCVVASDGLCILFQAGNSLPKKCTVLGRGSFLDSLFPPIHTAD